MPARMRVRGTAYAGASVALAGVVVLKALAQRPSFYSAAVYLSQSSANLMILTNLMFVVACTFMVGLQKLLYGPLRPIEVEQLYEKAWFAVTETCLAMTIFRGEIGPWFLIMFFALLAGKVWGWIGEGRVEILEQQPPRNPRLFHTRMALSLGLSIFFDLTMLEYVIKTVMRMAKPDMMVMFGFEFAVLSLLSLSTAARYAIQLVEIGIVREQKRKRIEEVKKERIEAAKKDLEEAQRAATTPAERENASAESAPIPSVEAAQQALRTAEQPVDENEVEVEGWEGKGRWIFYLDLATDFFKLVLYLSFFIILLVFYGLPIHIMRDVFLTCRSFIKRISDFIKYRTATRDMNARYPDATLEDIGREEVCIICREEMRPYQPPAEGQQQTNPVAERMRPKKLPCGHVLHFACLRSWLERQQVCPTCRRSVVPTQRGPNATPADAPGANGAIQGQHPPGDRPVARVFQLGPLRIGVGAARGEDVFNELQQQMADNRPRGRGRLNQQYQFGIRWDGRRRTRRAPHGTIREQLDNVDQQIADELGALSQNLRESALLRGMQLELERIRAQDTNTNQPAAGAAPVTATATGAQVQPQPVQPLPPQLGQMLPGITPFRPPQSLQPIPGERVLHAGNESLPAGMTLPEGWSMMPLRPTPAGVNHVMPNPAPGTLQFPPHQTFHGHFAGPMPVPDHIRAMFTNMPGQPANVGIHQHPAPVQPQPTAGSTINSQQTQQPGPNGFHVHPVAQSVIDRHEQNLASLQNPQQETQEMAVPTAAPEGDPSSQQPREQPVNGMDSHSSTNIPVTNRTQANSASAQPLPSWGSRPRTEHQNGDSTADRATAEDSGSGRIERKAKSATVEDLVEHPD